MAVTSLVLGILSIIFSFFGGINIVGAILGIIGIVLGALSRKNEEKKGIGTGGMVCSIIGTILCVIFYVACAACLASI
ncbi:hypothetical protein [Clostridium sp.]|uniref:hypothetical protein n=1 Tax=Clostridium sp. TaxID=1506 RepID=UPI00290ADEC3|nr:hypothetical protein [Clostridium sp.]MDU5106452.1 hypothetical protein [Clostridium sp.]